MLSVLGTGISASLLGTGAAAKQAADSQYVLVQGDECVPIEPLDNLRTAEKFYEYQLPEDQVSEENGAVVGDSAQYASAGTTDLQRAQTSIAFLYRGPQGLSLVFVHGSVEASDAGSITFEFSGLPKDGRWVVKDDLYRDPDSDETDSTNYDRWQVDGDTHQIDWTWGTAGTDGGAFRGLGDEFEVTIDPGFNEDAALYNEYYEGTVTDWQFLTGSADDPERVSLALDEPLRITTGSCEDGGSSDKSDQQSGQGDDEDEQKQEQEQKQDRDQKRDQEQNQERDSKDEEREQDQEESKDEEREQKQEQEQKQEGEEDQESNDEEREDDDSGGEDRGKGNGKGRGEGHEKGRGKGHEKGRGKGHDKREDDEEEDDDDDGDDDEDGDDKGEDDD